MPGDVLARLVAVESPGGRGDSVVAVAPGHPRARWARASRPRRGPRATSGRARRGPPRRGGEAAGGRPPHGTGERRRPRRRRLVRRVRPARHRRPTPPQRSRRPHRQHPRRRDDRRARHGQRRPVRRPCGAGGRDVVRLHRARRHPGHEEPLQEGSSLRARRAHATADRVLHRGRGRAPRRHGHARDQRSGLPRVPLVRPARPAWSRSSASTPATASPATPRSSAAATWSSPPRLEHRDGWPGDDRRRRARRVRADGDRTQRGAAGQRRGRHRPLPTRPRPCRSPSGTCRTSRGRWRRGTVPIRRCCARSCRRTASAPTTSARAVELLFDTGSVLELRRDFGIGMITALARIEGRPVGVIANNPVHLGGAIDSDGADKGGPLHAALRRLRPPA